MLKKLLKSLFAEPEHSKQNDVEKKEEEEIVLLREKLDFLQELNAFQKNRQTVIENKNSQLLGQASITVSVVALFVPLLLGELKKVDIWLVSVLTIAFLFTLCFYFSAIFHILKTLNIKKYPYASSTPQSAIKPTTKELIKERIADLLYSLRQNEKQDNLKGDNLIMGAKSFRKASISFLVFVFLMVGTILYTRLCAPSIQQKERYIGLEIITGQDTSRYKAIYKEYDSISTLKIIFPLLPRAPQGGTQAIQN